MLQTDQGYPSVSSQTKGLLVIPTGRSMCIWGFLHIPAKRFNPGFRVDSKMTLTTSEHIDDNMHVDEAQIDGGDTEAVTASNMENPGQPPIVLERGEVEAL